ncbi:hypothetical protein ACFQQB_65785 [Nonomuraea rubra]|uniref:hypothetical protein n=1 Tax=Nonomuraea rubra TaxID=46180 RepID=UPI0036234DA3
MDGLSPRERLVLAAIELELRRSGEHLASRLNEFNERAAQEGRAASPITSAAPRWPWWRSWCWS